MARRRLVVIRYKTPKLRLLALNVPNQAPGDGPTQCCACWHACRGSGIETATCWVQEVCHAKHADRRGHARSAGSRARRRSGRKSREKGLARSGNARVREAGSIGVGFFMFQKVSTLAPVVSSPHRERRSTRKTIDRSLASKHDRAPLWVCAGGSGEPDGVVMSQVS